MNYMPEQEQMLKRVAQKFFSQARGSHDWEHTRRVTRLAQTIGLAEKADLAVVTAAALLHDIGRNQPGQANSKICHAQLGVQLAEPVLAELTFSKEQKENILHAIAAHRYRQPPEPVSLEAKVVFDADKLDAIGAVGVARAYLFAGELGAKLHNPDIDVEQAPSYSENDTGYREYLVKLRQVNQKMMTDQGRQLAQARHNFMETFFERFLKEYNGEI